MDRKKIIMLVVGILMIVILGIAMFLVNSNNNNVLNEPIDGVEVIDLMLQDQMVENLKISNVSFVSIDGETNFFALVTNEGTEEIKVNNLYVMFTGDNFEKKITGLTDSLIKNGESVEIRITIDNDLSATKSIEYLLETNDE